jgi:aryl-alcohol dehydrogenase-like predicted oxidoreductase
VAIAWTLGDPAVTGAIVGARKRQQVDDVVAAAGVHLTQSERTYLQPVAELAGRGQ